MRKVKEPIDKLKENMEFLDLMIENPQRYGAYVLIGKIRGESKPPININLFDFKTKIDKEINKLNKKIYKKLRFDEVPDGLK